MSQFHRCKHCNRIKLISLKNFKPNKKKRTGFELSICRRCYNKRYADRNTMTNEQRRALHARNPHVRNTQNQNRRATVRNAQGTFNLVQFEAKFTYHGRQCYYCKMPLQFNAASADHRIPLIRGGSNWISNIVPACSWCNSKKGRKTCTEFKESLKWQRS